MSRTSRGIFFTCACIVAVLACGPSVPARPPQAEAPTATPPGVSVRSNENSRVLLDLEGRFEPEAASGDGVDGVDDQITDLGPSGAQRALQAHRSAERALRDRLLVEKDPAVRTDLDILIAAAGRSGDRIELEERLVLPFDDVAALVYRGVSVLLDEQVPAERRRAALVRLRRYVGAESGYTPITELAARRTRERLDRPGVLFPLRARVEKVLATSPILVDGLAKLFAKNAPLEHAALMAQLRTQLTAYEQHVRKTILPRARTDFRQPPELYQLALRESGIDAPPRELAAKAREAFALVQRSMQQLAPQVARERGLSLTDYRDVLRALKKDQLEGDALLAVYRRRIQDIDTIVHREHLATLPSRPVHVRLATDAESARIPAPFFSTPRLLDNTGELGEFVLPTYLAGDASKRLDDFSFEAASWWLTAHEGRPGHELQFSTMIEKKVSIARALFAFNSTNAEGWGLYAEEMIRPFMPIDGQLVCLQARLMRTAHAFLDIELNLGIINPDEARRVLREDGVFSEAWTNQSVERYTFTWPAQAPSYFYGYLRLTELRAETARAMGDRFRADAFHDFILAQGLVSPALLQKAVFAELVPQKVRE
jgi:Bacterial protein of unknown function (DUF885)